MMSQDEVSEQADAVQIFQGQMLNITLLASEWKSSSGGLSTLNRELAIHLSQIQNVRASLLVPEGACNDEDKREARSFGISILDARKCVGVEPLLWLSNPPQDHNIDVIVGHGVKLGCQVQFIRRQAQFQNCKWLHVVHTVPEDLSKYKGYSSPISRGEEKHWDEVDLCKCADLVIPVGPKLGKAYHSYLQECKKDEDFFELVPGVFEREFGELPAKQNPKDESDVFIVLLCGRGDEEDFELKGYNIAVKAFADQRLKGKHYSLLFVGSPEGKQDEVRKRLLKYGITDEQLTVREFVKNRERMKELFCEVDMVIMPSKSEGFGLVALEALSAGLPILVGSNSGFARAIKNIPYGKCSIVGDSGNPAKWAEAIEDVRDRHGMVLEESKILKEHYSKKYCWKKQCEELVDRLWKMVYGTSAAQAIATDDLVKQFPSVVPESICQPDPKTMQQQPCNIEKGGITSGRGKGMNTNEVVKMQRSELQLPSVSSKTFSESFSVHTGRINDDEKALASDGNKQYLEEIGETLINLLITAPHLNEEQQRDVYRMLVVQVEAYQERQDHSTDKQKGLGAMTESIIKTYGLYLENFKMGSLIIIFNCQSIESLEHLWDDYLSGHLDEMAEQYLVTDEMKERLNLETISLKITIERENYLTCRKVLLERSDNSDNPSVRTCGVMATAAPSPLASSEEKTNGAKLSRLLVDGGTIVLRDIFDSHHPPARLAADLKANCRILDDLFYRRILNRHQWDKLFPPRGVPPDSNSFDITLLFLLLTKMCGLTPPPAGWHAKPPSSDTSLEANLARVNFFRNVLYGHVTTSGIDTPSFLRHWNEISGVLMALGLDKAEIDRLKAERCGEEDYLDGEEDIKSQVVEVHQSQTETQQTLETVQADVQEIKQTISCLEGKQKEDTTDEVLQELAKSEFKGDIEHHAGRFQEGTREWIFTKVERWLDDRKSQNRVMVISGNAGMGKTVISAVICQRMQQAERLSGSHFCQHNNIRYKNPQLMLQSLACHLCLALPKYKEVLVETLSRNVGRRLNNMGVEELFALLFKEPLSCVCDPGHNMLMVIDGLDESEFKGRNELLDVIANHFCLLPVWIRFLVTTRPERNIAEKLKVLKPFLLEPTDEMNLEDIKTFFERRLQPAVKPDNFESIVAMLVAKCEGLMLYANFLVSYFEEKPSALHQASFDVSLPLGISSVYHTYFKRLENELITELGIKEEKFLDLLCCVCASREPLPIDLVSKVLLRSTDSPSARRRVLKALSSVSSLLPIRNGCLHVIHKSVKDWLTDTSCYGEHDFLMDEEVGHRLLGNLCAQELDDLKAIGVHKVQVSTAQKYALHHGARHLLHLDENRRQPKLDELAKKYVLDLEVLYARVCVNNSKATEDLFWLDDEDISSVLSEDSRGILTTLKFLLRKHHRRLINHPCVFLQAVLNEGGTTLSCVAANLLRSKYPEVSCLEYVLKDTQEEFVFARFCCSSLVACLDVSKGLDYMVCECIDGTVQLWSLQTGELVWTRLVKVAKCFDPRLALRFRRSLTLYRSVVFHPTENLVLPGILSHAYTTEGELKPLFPQSDCTFTVCSISGDMTKMLTDCPDNEKCLVFWSLTDGSEIARFSTDEAVVSFAWSPNGRLIAVSFCTRLMCLIDATTGFSTLVQREVPRVFGGIKFSPDHKALFAFALDHGKIHSCRFDINMVDNHSFSLDLSADDGGGFESHCDCGFLSGDVIPASEEDMSFYFRLSRETVLKFSPGTITIEMLNVNAAAIKPAAHGRTRNLVLSVNGDILYVLSGESHSFADLIGVWDTSSGNLIIEKKMEHISCPVAVREGVLFPCRQGFGYSVELWDSKLAACIYRWTNLGQITWTIPISETRVACMEQGHPGIFKERWTKATILDTSSRSVVASVLLDYRREVVAFNSKCQVVTASGHTLQCWDGTSVLWETDLGLPAHNSDDHRYSSFFGMFSPADKYLLIRVHGPGTDYCHYVLDPCSGSVRGTLLKGQTDAVDCKFISDVECVVLYLKWRWRVEEVRLELYNVPSGDLLTVLDLDHALDCTFTAVCPRNRFIVVDLSKSSRSSSKFKVIRAWSSERKVCGNNGRMSETE